jgi:hypothetical protein
MTTIDIQPIGATKEGKARFVGGPLEVLSDDLSGDFRRIGAAIIAKHRAEITLDSPEDLWRLSLDLRKEILLETSYISKADPSVVYPCAGYRVSASGKLRRAEHVCLQRGYYKYTFLRLNAKTDVVTKHFCWRHLLSDGIETNDRERARLARWLKAHGYLK